MSREPALAARVAGRVEHTLLDAAATRADVERLCQEALELGFAAVCVNPLWVAACAERLRGTPVLVVAVADFPLGAGITETRALEARLAAEQGAHEVDVVLRLGHLLAGDYDEVGRDLAEVVRAASPARVKAILETGRLDRDRKVAAARIAVAAGAAFVKTSTGYFAGATVEDVALLRETVGADVGIKASGGIRTLAGAAALLEAGATRLGTSAGARLVRAEERR